MPVQNRFQARAEGKGYSRLRRISALKQESERAEISRASAAMDGEASEATGNVPFPERIVPHDPPENRKRRAPLEPFE
jgi:hypothetical protein